MGGPPGRVTCRAGTEGLGWTSSSSWTAAGWMVQECSSSEQDIQLLGTSAVFSHRVGTTVRTSWAGAREVSDERETIVFVKTADGRILCVHEHHSVSPADF